MNGKVVSIHQPNFFPWFGYFDKIVRSDAFIFLDDVQFPKKGGTWSNRVKLLVNGKARWITAAIDRSYHGFKKVNEIKLKANEKWRDKILKTIKFNYKSSPYFDEVFPLIRPLIQNDTDNLSNYNTYAILTISRKLGIPESRFHWQSKLPFEGTANEMLITLTKSLDGDIYMCGGGADEYQEDALFKEHGIKLKYQNFSHPIYIQEGEKDFVKGLSIIDALMSIGFTNTSKLLYQD